jgi:ABC-2 type transport system ATP-binding protein
MIGGADDPSRANCRRQLGAAPQALAIYDELTAQENLRFFGSLYGLRGRELSTRVTTALEIAGLVERQGDRVSTFSGGMKRRLNLVCALVHDPPVLFLDEPTVGVDPQSRSLIFSQIEKLRDAGRTIIYTTHYMEEAQRLCDRVAIIDQGKILDLDTVDNLIDRHGGTAIVKAELDHEPDESASLPGQLDGLQLTFKSDQPLEEIAQLSGAGIVFRTLRVDRPDLESVFLNLTGRRLRD